jgi:tetrahydromethanopterin S-methyltransferase subunit G
MKNDLAELAGVFVGVILFYVLPIILVMLAIKWIFLT